MNVFVLCTGRSGSVTFVHACQHMTNFTSGHETNIGRLGEHRLRFPDNHIEADNRLSWFLGRLDRRYGDRAFYVHLKRDRLLTAKSYSRRFQPGYVMPAYANGIYMDLPGSTSRLDIALDYHDTVTANIEAFLRDKTRKQTVQLEQAKPDFEAFWHAIGAEGDLAAALGEFEVAHNARGRRRRSFLSKLTAKAVRVAKQLPRFVRDA